MLGRLILVVVILLETCRAATLSVLAGDGRDVSEHEAVGGLCVARLVPQGGEIILDPVVMAGDLRLIAVTDQPVPTFWLPCDSLSDQVELRASWSSPIGSHHRLSRTLSVRNLPLRIRVEVAPGLASHHRIYAAGSLHALGRLPDGTWQPRAFALTPLGGGHWFGVVMAGPGDGCMVEFTKGGWGTKGRTAAGRVIKLTQPIVASTGISARVDNFGVRSGAVGTIAEHVSICGPAGDCLAVAFRDQRISRILVGPSPGALSPHRLRKDAGGMFAELSNLRPGETRSYALDPGGQPRLLRVPSSEELMFCVIGDIQGNPEILPAMMAHETPQLVVHPGDLVNAGWNEEDWTRNMAIIQPAASVTPYMVVPGNHEENSPIFGEVFHFPHAEYYYAFAWGPARFLMLDSEAPYEPGTLQRAFAESVLAAWAPAPGPIFVALHAPPYSTGMHGSDYAVRRELCPLFESAGVSVVFSGHDHGYSATWPLRDSALAEGGTVYVVAAGGGARLYMSRPHQPAWCRLRVETHHWLRVHASRDRVEVEARTPDGATFDRFLVRPGQTSETRAD